MAVLTTVYAVHSVRETIASTDPNSLLARGHTYYDANDFERAISSYQEAIRLDPACKEAHECLSQCYRETGQYAESLDTWRQARSNLPEWKWARVQLAFDYNDLGMYDRAIEEWKQLIELDPDIAGLNALLADVYLKAGRYEEAVAACTRALELQPGNKKARHNLARTYLKLGRPDLASKEYEILKTLDEGQAGRLLVLLKDYRGGAEQTTQRQPPPIDPSAMLDEQHRTALSQISPLFDAQEQVLRSQIEATKGDLYKQYLVEAKGLSKLGLNQEQAEKSHQQLQPKYRLTFAKATAEIELALKELALERRKAVTRVDTEFAGRETQLQQIRTMEKEGQISPAAAGQEHLRTLGFSPSLQLQTENRESQIGTESDLPENLPPIVEAVVAGAGNRLCVLIGGDLVSEGDVARGYRIRKIRENSVEFEKEGKIWLRKVD